MITFAIPYYSDPVFLEAAISSVLAQRRADWRLIVVDDQSPHPPKVPDDQRIRYVRNDKNLGMAGNWNRCLDLAETRFVTILHADDELEPTYIDTVLPLLGNGATAAFCGANIIDAQGRATFYAADAYKRLILPRGEPMRLVGERGLAALLRGNFITCPSVCYDKDALASTRFDARFKFVLDLDFMTRLLLDGHTIVGTRTRAYRYRRHNDNATVHLSKNLIAFDEEVALWSALSNKAKARGWKQAAKLGRKMRIVKNRVAFEAVRDALRGDLATSKKKAAFLLK